MKPTALVPILLALPICGCDPSAHSSSGVVTSSGVTAYPADYPLPSEQLFPLTEKIHALVVSKSADRDTEAMRPYDESIELVPDYALKMVPLPAGSIALGSPESEPGRTPDEGPRRTVKINPFWISSTEITWALYLEFMDNGKTRNKDGSLDRDADIQTPDPPVLDGSTPLVDVISQPTPPYSEMHFDMGDGDYSPEYPAFSMTHHAASKFCEWLTAHTGHFYRLPTEAEWEYAARAGTTTAYAHGDDPAALEEHAWFIGNSRGVYHPVAQKKPNAWGLYDMHGNAAEWVLDAPADGFRAALEDDVLNPWRIPQQRYPRLAKGGSWLDPAERLRVGARTPSSPVWKHADPQAPKSIWYLTNNEKKHPVGYPVGFRVVRPLRVPSAEDMHRFWNTDWFGDDRNAEDI